ncbi:DUF4038 domain-containing protein, partial [Bacteroidota bacterium]
IPFKANIPKGQDPFKVEFSASFTGPTGKTMKIPGFYNGSNEWVIRFSASLPGKWEYITHSSVKKLDNRKGSLSILDKSKEGQHGGIVIPENNPQHFAYEDGTPYFLMAWECDWLYALDYHDDNGVPKTEHFLDLIAGNGCNQLVMNVFSYDVSWPKDPKLKERPEHDLGGPTDIFPFLGNNENPDYSALNIEFFQKFDRTISIMNEKGIISHLMIYVWNKLVNWPDMNSEADNLYFDYVVKRYQAFPNIIFDISKEALFYGRADNEYILERIERVRKLNTFNRLVTVHDYGFCSRYPESVDFISMQTWTSTLYTFTLNTVQKYNEKPVFNIEHGGYEESPYTVWTGDFTNAEICLRRNYMILFGGGYSTYYWQGCSWNVLIHNPFQQPEDYIKPHFEYYRYLNEFFTKQNFSKLKPAPQKNYSGYCLEGQNGEYLIYVPKENYQVQANFFREDAWERSFIWFNTLTGEYAPPVKLSSAVGGSGVISGWQNDVHLRSPWQGEADAILISEMK